MFLCKINGIVCTQYNMRDDSCATAVKVTRLHREAAALTAVSETQPGVIKLAHPHRQAVNANVAILPSGLIHGTSSGGLPNSTGGLGPLGRSRGSPAGCRMGPLGWGKAWCPLGTGEGQCRGESSHSICQAGFLWHCSPPPHT